MAENRRAGWLAFGFMFGLVSTSFEFSSPSFAFDATQGIFPRMVVVAIGLIFWRFICNVRASAIK